MAEDRLKTLEERTRYEPSDVEARVFARWEQSGIFHPEPEGTPDENYSIAVPPPNVTGNLHMGHALNASIQDLKIRVARMRGQRAKWIYGKDHAGIATQRVVEQQLQADGSSREEIGREAFVERVWEWVQEYGDNITRQFRELGASLDYEDERFTMDEDYVRAVTRVFVHLYEKGLVYRDNYMVNWDPGLRTAISDLEVEQRTVEDTLYMVDYPLESGSGSVTVATVRPETMLADTAIAVNPSDERYSRLIGEAAILPLVGRRLPIIADDYVDPEFGTGALKITPGHDQSDFDIGRRHGLEEITVIGEDGRITDAAPERFRGMETAEALDAVVAELREEGLISGTQPYVHDVPHSHRSGRRVEPLISLQWFCDMDKLARPGDRRGEGRDDQVPSGEALDRRVPELAREHPALVHLAAALVGTPAAGLVPRRGDVRGRERPGRRRLGARPGRARHLVLLGPVAVRDARLAECDRGAARLLSDGRELHGARHHLPLGRAHGDVRQGAHRAGAVHRREHPLGDPGAGRPADVEVARDRDRSVGPDPRRRAPARVRGGRRVPGVRRRRAALRPARDVLVAGRALQRGAREAGPRPRQQALERGAPDPAARVRGGAGPARRAGPSRTAGSSRGWSA